jgi:hypothetical protein
MHEGNYFVDVWHRPRRVAFLVDVDQSPAALFDKILEFNVSSWGGRYNPIIPVFGGLITEPYWQLLKLANPDIVYTYCDLSATIGLRVLTEIRPLDVLKHGASLQSNGNEFRVRINWQATVVPALSRIVEEFPAWARKPEPAALTFDPKDIPAISPFLRRNFGATGQYYFFCRDHQIPSVALSPNDRDVMRVVATNQNLLLPINVCARAPVRVRAMLPSDGVVLTLCIGTSPWNFVEYWNSAQFASDVGRQVQSISEMWIEPSLLQDENFYEAFIELIRRRVFTSGHAHRLRLISYDQTKEYMGETAKRICEDYKWGNLFPADPIVRTPSELAAFETRAAVPLSRPSEPSSKQVSGRRPFLELSPPGDGFPGRDERWIAELAIESPEQERFFANRTTWWKLPLKNAVASLFAPELPSRVGNGHLISVEISSQVHGIILNTPELTTLFAKLLIPQVLPAWARTLNPSHQGASENTLYLRLSDKGMYARGVLGLFESLQKAAYIFEHTFWRGVVESLASPVHSEQTRHRVRKRMEEIGNESLTSPNGIDLVVDMVLETAGHIQRPIHYTNFRSLLDRYWNYMRALPDDGKVGELGEAIPNGSEISGEEWFRDPARRNLQGILSELTARKVFLQGAVIQCNHCLASLWYHVDDLGSIVTCRGCRRGLNLPAEVPWSYALNELVVSAVRDHGIIPVVRTAFRLFEDSRECFCFLSGVEIRDYKSDPEMQVCEIDLVWIRDGEFGVAEVKRKPNKLTVGNKLATLLGVALPDRLLLASPVGTAEEMQEVRSRARSKAGGNINVETWGADKFAHSLHLGWNSVRYKVL